MKNYVEKNTGASREKITGLNVLKLKTFLHIYSKEIYFNRSRYNQR